MTRLAVLTLLLAGASSAPLLAADAVTPPRNAEDQPIDPGKPTDALKTFEAKPSADERNKQERANPDPMERSVLPIAAGAGLLVLPFLGWLAVSKLNSGK